MKKLFIGIVLSFCMTLSLLTVAFAAETTSSATNAANQAHDRLADGGYHIYCMAGNYITTDGYPSKRSVELAFPDSTRKVFYVENKGNNQITLMVQNSYSDTGYSYIGIDSSIKDGTALKLVDSPYLWNTYVESNTSLTFSLRPATNTKMLASASGGSGTPRTKLILWTKSDMDAPKHGELRFEPVKDSSRTPVADDYNFANLNQTEGAVTPVLINCDSTKSPGAITVYYDGSTELPKKAGTYRVTFDVAAVAPLWKAASGLNGGTLVIAPKPSTADPVGKQIKMGGLNWRVLDVQDGKALVISELILDCMPFQKDSYSSAWADSTLREYLNGDFYNKTFSSAEKKRIVSTELVNNINPEYSSNFGTDTKDKVFLLSAEEVGRYFSKDKDRIAYADRRTPALLYSPVNSLELNPYEGIYQYYTDWYWWLRTPGHPGKSDRDALYVNRSGEVSSYDIRNENIGIRPAMWIKLDGGGFTKYQPLKFNEQPKYFTMEDMVKAIAVDIIYEYTGDWVYNFGYPANGPGVSKAQNEVGLMNMMPPGYAEWFHVFRMRCWGVLSFDNFDPFAKVTYGQFKNYLMKTMEWNLKYGADGNKNFKFTKEILAIAEKKAGIKNTKDSATPVKEEIKRLSREIIYWFKAANTLDGKGVRLLESPTKTSYKVGDKFDITGLLVVTGAYGKEANVNNKLTFTAAGVKITPGYKFQSAGTKSIEVSYNGQKLLTYPVTVKK